jgi:hypothetical protein
MACNLKEKESEEKGMLLAKASIILLLRSVTITQGQ